MIFPALTVNPKPARAVHLGEPTDDSRHSVHKRQSGRLSRARERQSTFCHRTRTSHDRFRVSSEQTYSNRIKRSAPID
jgi:hypothetical protein